MNIKRNIKVSEVFPKYLFWEFKVEMLDFKKDKNLIIPRALYFTDKKRFNKDILKLEKFYTKTEILETIQSTKELISNDVCKQTAKRYNAPIKLRFSA